MPGRIALADRLSLDFRRIDDDKRNDGTSRGTLQQGNAYNHLIRSIIGDRDAFDGQTIAGGADESAIFGQICAVELPLVAQGIVSVKVHGVDRHGRSGACGGFYV